MTSLRDVYQEIRELGAEVLAISGDSVHAHKAWSKMLGGIPYPMLGRLGSGRHQAVRHHRTRSVSARSDRCSSSTARASCGSSTRRWTRATPAVRADPGGAREAAVGAAAPLSAREGSGSGRATGSGSPGSRRGSRGHRRPARRRSRGRRAERRGTARCRLLRVLARIGR